MGLCKDTTQRFPHGLTICHLQTVLDLSKPEFMTCCDLKALKVDDRCRYLLPEGPSKVTKKSSLNIQCEC